VGLALLSKHTAALLAPALFLLVWIDRDLRDELRTPWPWLGGAVAILLFLPNLLWNATHDWVAIQFQIRHGTVGQATLRSSLEFAGGLLGGAGVVALPLGVWQLVRGRGSFSLRVAAATLVPIAVTVLSATRGRVEANWVALVVPALCGAAAVALVRMRQAWSQALLAFTVGLGMLAAVGFGLEVRNPTLIPLDSEVLKRFRGWPEFARRARAAAGSACTAIGNPSGCDPANPFVFPVNYQEAAELAFYGGWTRFGPAAERPSQFDIWDDHPSPGEPFLALGTIPPERRLFRAGDPGPRTSFEVRFRGEVLQRSEMEPFRAWQGAFPRRATGLP
jgi:hypothetical protein